MHQSFRKGFIKQALSSETKESVLAPLAATAAYASANKATDKVLDALPLRALLLPEEHDVHTRNPSTVRLGDIADDLVRSYGERHGLEDMRITLARDMPILGGPGAAFGPDIRRIEEAVARQDLAEAIRGLMSRHVTSTTTSPTVLLHELGHGTGIGKSLLYRAATSLADSSAPLVGIGLLANKEHREQAPLAAAALSAPTILEEMRASGRALSHMARQKGMGYAAKESIPMLAALGTYLRKPVALVGATYGISKLLED